MWVRPYSEEEENEITRMVLMKFRRPNQRRWEFRDPGTRTWVPAGPYQVLKYVKSSTDLVTKVSGRPESHYKDLYSRIGFLALDHQRERWFQENYPTIPLDR